MSYLLAGKCIFKWRFKAQPHYIFTTKPAPQANLETSEYLPKKKVLTAAEPVLPSSSKKSRVYAISLGVSRVVCIMCNLFESYYLLIYWKHLVPLTYLWLITPDVLQVSAHHCVSLLLVYAIVNFCDKIYILSNNGYTLRCCG